MFDHEKRIKALEEKVNKIDTSVFRLLNNEKIRSDITDERTTILTGTAVFSLSSVVAMLLNHLGLELKTVPGKVELVEKEDDSWLMRPMTTEKPRKKK